MPARRPGRATGIQLQRRIRAAEGAGRYGTRISSQLTSMRAFASLMATAFGGIETVPIFPVQ